MEGILSVLNSLQPIRTFRYIYSIELRRKKNPLMVRIAEVIESYLYEREEVYMNRKIALLIVTIIVVLSIGNMTVEAATSKTINLGSTTNLKVKTKETIKWSSSNKKVLSVDKKGNITAKKVGKATITAKVNNKSYKFYFTVVDLYADSTKLAEAKQQNIKMIAHRGMSALAPENTLEAMDLAATYGFEMVEFDVSQTKDGKFIVMHDKSVERTTNGTGKISKLTYAKIKSFNIDGGNGYSKQYKNVKVPSLEEILKLCKTRKLTPLIHIKSVSDITGLLKVVKKAGFANDAILCSNNRNTLLNIKSVSSKTKLMLVDSSDGLAAVNFAKENQLMGINISSKVLNLEVVIAAKENNLTVYVWDVETSTLFDALVGYGIDGVVSNGVLE